MSNLAQKSLNHHLKNALESGVNLIPKGKKAIVKIQKAIPMDKIVTLEDLRACIGECTRCPLHTDRQNIVFGQGAAKTDLMFVGEAPGSEEDKTGLPFVGRAGKLLTDMILAMGLDRDRIYIANVVKCRPPGNRNPEPIEIENCEPFLKKQVELIKPRVIIALGKFASQTLLQTEIPITKLRGEFQDYGQAKLMPTYHPAYLLRNPAMKRAVWEDLQKVMHYLGLKPPPKVETAPTS